MTSTEDSFVYAVRADGTKKYAISVLSPTQLQELGGMPFESVVGWLKTGIEDGGMLVPENFLANVLFVDFLSCVIGKHGPDSPGMREAARQSRDGAALVIDARTPNPGAELSEMYEDIIGWFDVQNGELIPGSYQHNGRHLLVSAHGLTRLDEFFRERMLWELRQLPPMG